MKNLKFVFLPAICLSVAVLTSCGMYVGSPPGKTEVRETTTTSSPPPEVRVYTP